MLKEKMLKAKFNYSKKAYELYTNSTSYGYKSTKKECENFAKEFGFLSVVYVKPW